MSEATVPSPWRIVGSATISNLVGPTAMIHAVFGLFIVPLSQTFGWPRAAVSGVLAVVAVATALSLPAWGRLADARRSWSIIFGGKMVFGVAMAALATLSGQLWLYYLLFAVLGISGAMSGTVLLAKIVSGWYANRRGLYLGFVGGVGSGGGSTVAPIICAALMVHWGWRGAYLGLALLILLIGLPALMCLREAPRDHVPAGAEEAGAATQRGFSLREAARTGTFWLILVSIALGAGSMTALFSHVVPVMLDRGYTIAEGTAVISVFSLVCIACQIAIGVLLDRVPSPRVALPFYLCAFIGVAWFSVADTMPTLLASGALMGVGLGTEYGVLPYFAVRYFGLRAYGAIYGSIYGTVVLVMGFTPPLMDHVFDVTGSYQRAIDAICVALLIGTSLLAFLRPYGALGAGADAQDQDRKKGAAGIAELG